VRMGGKLMLELVDSILFKFWYPSFTIFAITLILSSFALLLGIKAQIILCFITLFCNKFSRRHCDLNQEAFASPIPSQEQKGSQIQMRTESFPEKLKPFEWPSSAQGYRTNCIHLCLLCSYNIDFWEMSFSQLWVYDYFIWNSNLSRM
jgi:hypothetical protein